jgi:hypothetical protein
MPPITAPWLTPYRLDTRDSRVAFLRFIVAQLGLISGQTERRLDIITPAGRATGNTFAW